jgi:hypothetical protein
MRARLFVILFAVPVVVTLTALGRATQSAPYVAEAGRGASPAIQISDDPFTNASSQHRTEVEADTFAFGSTWVSAFMAGKFSDAGASGIGFATSSDHGHTFANGFLPGTTTFANPPGAYDRVSDPAVAFDRRHRVWLISYLAHGSTPGGAAIVDLLASRSPDAVHWDLPVPVAALGSRLDKSWTVCDNSPPSPFFGHCYAEFDIPSQDFSMRVTRSTDGGLTWDEPRIVTSGDGGQPVVQPGGRVVVAFVGRCGGPRVQNCAFSSDDGGTSWNAPVAISARMFHPTAPLIVTPPLPSAAVDRDGRIYVVWKDCRFEVGCTATAANDLLLSTSDDGASWSPARRIPLDPIGSNVDHFIPGIAVDPASAGDTARLALTYYFLPVANCTLATCELKVGFVSSINGGETWSTPEVLAGPMKLTWLAQTTQGRMVGDYISTSVLNGGALALPAFAVGLPPEDGILHQAIFTAREKVRGGSVPMDPSGGVPMDADYRTLINEVAMLEDINTRPLLATATAAAAAFARGETCVALGTLAALDKQLAARLVHNPDLVDDPDLRAVRADIAGIWAGLVATAGGDMQVCMAPDIGG